jgi:hypothetical protein
MQTSAHNLHSLPALWMDGMENGEVLSIKQPMHLTE